MSDKKQLVAKPSKIDNYLNADKGFKKSSYNDLVCLKKTKIKSNN